MERKKLKVNPALYMIDYKVRLKQYDERLKSYFENTHFGNELTFLHIELTKVEEEIKEQERIISEVLSSGNPDKIQGTSNDPGNLNYIDVWHVHNLEYLNWLKQRKATLEKPDRIVLKYLDWTGTHEQLDYLFNGLKEAHCIDPKTDLQAFRMIFSIDLTQCEAVNWTASNRLLAYLFNQMKTFGYISSSEWQSIIGKNKLFLNKSGKYLTTGDLATALNSINDPFLGNNPKGYEEIDTILRNL